MKVIAIKKVSWILFVGLITAVPTSYGWSQKTNISQEDYGDAWPLTVPDATLHCARLRSMGRVELAMVWVEHAGISYPINGMASSHLAKVHPDLTVRPLEDIWQYNDRYPGTVIRITISPLIKDGLKLCGI